MTLIEMLLVIALIVAIAAFSTPLFISTQVKNDLDLAAQSTAHSMRRAQALAQASDGDTSWGVSVQGGAITLFKGASFAGRDASYDEAYDLPSSIMPTGLTEVVFAKFTGVPSATGTLTLTAAQINQSHALIVNALGGVGY